MRLNKPQRRYNVPLLFGTLQPGLLYDAQLEAPLTGHTLFPDPQFIEEPTVTVDTETFIEYTTLERIDKMKVGVSLALSFMGGLIEVNNMFTN